MRLLFAELRGIHSGLLQHNTLPFVSLAKNRMLRILILVPAGIV